MEVNTTIWGNSSTWRNFTMRSSGMTVTVKIPSSAKRDYVRTYTTGNNRLPMSIDDDIDQSPALWGIGKDALLHKQFLTYVTWNADDENDRFKVEMKSALDDSEIGKSKPLILFSCNKNDNASTEVFNPFYSNSMERYAPTITALYERPYAFSPILNLNYKTIMLLPYIACVSNTDKYAQSGYSLYDINSFNTLYESEIANQKTVVGFVWRYFWGSDGNRAANQQTSYKSIGFACSYKYKAYISASGSYTSEPTYDYKNIYGCNRYSYSPSEQCMINGIINNALNSSITSFDIANANYGRENNGAFSRGAHTFWFDDEVMEFINNGNTSSPKTRAVFKSTLTKQEIIDYTKKQTAFIGFPFCDDINHISDFVGSNNIFYPVFSNGITTGEYVNGSAVFDSDNYKWGEDIREKADYDPTKPETPDEKDKGELSNLGGFRKFPTSLTLYALSQTKFESLIQALNNLYITDPDGNAKWELDFKGSNPSDYIVAAYATLCDIGLTTTTYPIKIGPVNLADIDPNMDTYKVSFADSGYFDCGSIAIEPEFGDFRDYAPYTQIEVYLPLCGTVDVDPAYFMGHSMSITYWYDVSTMSCSACIYRDGITLYKVVNGSLGAEIPLTSLRMGDYQNSIHALEQAQKQNEMRMASAMVSMGISAAGMLAAPATGGASLGLTALGLSGLKSGIETVNAMDDIQYQMTHTQPAISQTSASEPQNAFCAGGVYPKVYIKRAKTLESFDPDIYGHTVGYACNVNAYIGDMSGYTVATNIDTSGINATVDEINAIKQAFSKGVYL